MRDVRLDRWAELLVHYSLRAKQGHYVVIQGEVEALPLIEACYEKLLEVGAIPELFLQEERLKEILFEKGTDAQIAAPQSALVYAVQKCDGYLVIQANNNTRLLAEFDLQKQVLARQARKPVIDAFFTRSANKEMRWVLTYFPTAGAAQEAGMGTRAFEEFVFSLCGLNEKDPMTVWKQLSDRQEKLIHFLSNKKELHFQNADGTDLKVNIASMKWENCDGRINFPDGEVFTGPNLNAADGGVNGVARYSMPTFFNNCEVQDIELYFEKGAVVEARASKGEAFLHKMIEQDPGAKLVGEIAIGTNYNMDKITKNILFDEKFGGTFHLALGKGYPQTGNMNQSALHWDIIFDLRQGGSITADGELLLKDGKFLKHLWF
jgi:aminopeptidase